MFGFGKKKKEAAAQEAASADVYVAPVTGEYLPLSEVSDPVFSQGVMGDGYAVNPTAGTIVAPVAGTISPEHTWATRWRQAPPSSRWTGQPSRVVSPPRKPW